MLLTLFLLQPMDLDVIAYRYHQNYCTMQVNISEQKFLIWVQAITFLSCVHMPTYVKCKENKSRSCE